MSDKWKDIFIIITLGIMAVLASITLVDYLLVKTFKLDGTVTIGFIGTILGGVISGALTLAGVNLTLKHNEQSDGKKTRSKRLAYIINVQNEVVDLINYIEDFLKIYDLRHISLAELPNYPGEEQQKFAEVLIGYLERVESIIFSKEIEEKLIIVSAEVYIEFNNTKDKIKLSNREIRGFIKEIVKGGTIGVNGINPNIIKIISVKDRETTKKYIHEQLVNIIKFKDTINSERLKI